MQEEGVLEWFESRSVTDAAISLNQEPRAGYGIKSSWITLQCIIKNCGIIYVQSAKRAFTPQDDCPPPMPLVSFYISTGDRLRKGFIGDISIRLVGSRGEVVR
jgi:hypothetical protein